MNLLDLLVETRVSNVEPAWFSEIFDKLIWMVDPDKLNISSTYIKWLKSADDQFKVEVVLRNKVLFPIRDVRETEELLNKVSTNWPSLSSLCNDFLSRQIKEMKIGKS